MCMPRFFIRQNQIDEYENSPCVRITGDDAHHISRSLRMAVGEVIDVVDMQKNLYTCKLAKFNEGEVVAIIVDKRQIDTEPPVNIKLYQALAKGDKMETIIQKSIECVLAKLYPSPLKGAWLSSIKRIRAKKQNGGKKLPKGQPSKAEGELCQPLKMCSPLRKCLSI